MNFFKSLIIDDPDPPESPRSESPPHQQPHHPSGSDPNPTPEPQWTFGGLIKTLQVKSDWIDTYRKDLEEFGSGLKKETQIFQQVASKAVKDIPTSIDSIGSTLLKSTAEILSLDHDDGSNGGGSSGVAKSSNLDGKYNRFDAQLRNIQCDVNTYVMEVDDVGEFEEWKLGFDLGEKRGEIEGLMKENEVVEGIYNRVVVEDGGVVDYDEFWLRYYYRVYKLVRAENVRAKLVNRVNLVDEEEELSWDVDDDDDDDDEEREANVGGVAREGGGKGKKVEGEVEMGHGLGDGSRNVSQEGGGKGKKVEKEVEMGHGLGDGSRNVGQEGGGKGKKVEEEVEMGDGLGFGSSNVSREGGIEGKKVEKEAKTSDGFGDGSTNVSGVGGIEGKIVEKEAKMNDGFGDGSSNVTREGGIEGKIVEKEAKMYDGLGDGSSNQTPTQHSNMSAGLGFDLSNVTQKDDLHVKDLQVHKESEGVVSDKGSEEKGSEEVMNKEVLSNDQLGNKVEVKEVVKEGKNEASESGKDSDISVVSTQHSAEEDDMGWDEIEDIGSGDEKKVSSSGVSNREELRKRLSVANVDDDDEDLSWDIDDNDD